MLLLSLGSCLDDELLVLKNGKLLTCEAYQRDERQVTITRAGETFSLPLAMIDWDKTAQEVARREAEARSRAEVEARLVAEQAERQAIREAERLGDEPIVLDNDRLYDRHGARQRKSVTISYRKIGNNILVATTINGRGPFDFVLDTGAEVTLLSPQTVATLGIATGNSARVSGVGGQSMTAGTAVLDEIAVGGARVGGLTAIVRGIPQLNTADVVGLLGQDYLDHFVVHLDSASQSLTLTPHGIPTDSRMDPAAADVAGNVGPLFDELNGIIDRVRDSSESFLASSGSDNLGTQPQRLKSISARLPQLQTQVNELYDAINAGTVSAGDSKAEEAFLRCYPHFKAMLRELSNQTRILRQGYDEARKPGRLANAQQTVAAGWQRVQAKGQDYLSCVE